MGTMVIGKVESGSVGKGSTLIVMPNRVSLCAVFPAPQYTLLCLVYNNKATGSCLCV